MLATGVTTGEDRRIGLLLIPPLGADRWFWDDCVALWRGSVSCIQVTLPSAVMTAAGPAPVSIDHHAAGLEALRRRLGFERVVPVGCAIGSMIAAGYAARYGAATAALVLANATARSSAAATAMLTERADVVRRGGMAAILPEALDRGFLSQPRDARYRRYYDGYAAQPAEHYALSALAAAGYDVADDLRRIACSTLVVAGGHDVLLPPAQAREVAELVPVARFEMLKEAAHYAPYQSPQRFCNLVRGFLDSLKAVRAAG